jgi:hypothetical protein
VSGCADHQDPQVIRFATQAGDGGVHLGKHGSCGTDGVGAGLTEQIQVPGNIWCEPADSGDPNAGTASGQGTNVGYINDLGEVTGSYTDSSGNTVAFAGPVGTFRTVSDPVAPPFSTLTAAINDGGVVVGEYVDTAGDFQGFTEVRGVFTPVEDPAGTAGTNVAGISNLGVIVGFYVDSSGNFHGFELSPAR